MSFSIPEQSSDAIITDGNVEIEMVYDTDISSLVPVFELSEGATAEINEVVQTSGESVVDFSSGSVEYIITSEAAKVVQTWSVTVTVEDQSSIEQDNNLISVFPIPANDFVNIINAESSILKVYDIFGKLVLETEISSNTQKINTSELSYGIYNFKIEEGSNISNFKVVISK